jgi:hypothetical protein
MLAGILRDEPGWISLVGRGGGARRPQPELVARVGRSEVANILEFVTSSRVGTRATKLPEPTHVDLLRNLGLAEAVSPHWQRYRLSSSRGLSGIRKVEQ